VSVKWGESHSDPYTAGEGRSAARASVGVES